MVSGSVRDIAAPTTGNSPLSFGDVMSGCMIFCTTTASRKTNIRGGTAAVNSCSASPSQRSAFVRVVSVDVSQGTPLLEATSRMASSAQLQYCHLCGELQNLKRCGACRSAWYCSREHQVRHWPAHQHACRASRQQAPPNAEPRGTERNGSDSMSEDELRSIVNDLCNNHAQWIDSLSIQLTIPPPENSWLEQMKLQVVHDMNNFGVCVVDNFLGSDRSNEIYAEVVRLYRHRNLFQRGQVVNEAGSGGVMVRGDHIAWLEGSEPYCNNIRFLIRSLDSIVARCAAHTDSAGEMGLYRITQRTKAMLACYPGGGTRYFKHVDNPNFDGRKITCIYYVNKDWEGTRDGGLLRIFPENHRNHVASVEPILDRLVMFWSDRRNPHEVLPAQRMRFAITVWYLDDNEIAMQTCLPGGSTVAQTAKNQMLAPFRYENSKP